ncbi:DUF2793 domain-containing protein [Pararhodobacter oceanensis]|uniref:DUF2793 domain-containing protein n=1 Tax=Pararhodobacter oceanensis TaxID=2172121 RepID=UPI003A934611
MPEYSTNLALPYLQAAQAQKHITHNEALERLDLLVQLRVEGFAQVTPPAAPQEGQVWALGAGAVNDWAGQDGALAAWANGGWLFVTPQVGWRAALGAELRIWDGADWVAPALPALQNLAGLGVNAGYDAVNRLAVSAEATLLNHEGAGHQLKLNKAASGDTASLLFQTGWSGRAEMGTAGGDDFAIKVSADGATWHEALKISGSGLASGTAVTQSPVDLTMGRLLRSGDFGLGTAITLGAADDLDALAASGLYYTSDAADTSGNNYPMAAAGALVNLRRSASEWMQSFTTAPDTAQADEVRQFTRSYGAGGWSPWVEVIHQGRIVGTVSEASGVPTGSVIESGTTANGRFLRLADGTQVCWQALALGSVLASGSGSYAAPYATAAMDWTYPAAFSAPPQVSGSALAGGSDSLARAMVLVIGGSDAAKASDISAMRITGSAVDLSPTAHLIAVGRWF